MIFPNQFIATRIRPQEANIWYRWSRLALPSPDLSSAPRRRLFPVLLLLSLSPSLSLGEGDYGQIATWYGIKRLMRCTPLHNVFTNNPCTTHWTVRDASRSGCCLLENLSFSRAFWPSAVLTIVWESMGHLNVEPEVRGKEANLVFSRGAVRRESWGPGHSNIK